VLIDSGAIVNFIDSSYVKWCLQVREHDGFWVQTTSGLKLCYVHRVPQLSITLDNYTFTNDFYVVGIEDTNVVLGV